MNIVLGIPINQLQKACSSRKLKPPLRKISILVITTADLLMRGVIFFFHFTNEVFKATEVFGLLPRRTSQTST